MLKFNFETGRFEYAHGIPDWILLKWWMYATYESHNEALADLCRRLADF